MSGMKELVQDIEYLLNTGLSFSEVARELEIPMNFVVEASEIIHQQELEEDRSPYATINS